ncbi:MAG: hypothetical protein JWQ38_1862 [Flavipsychrobacter sp.]|nr:hypothetical protein [Flavipsychrobacter sp.]
MKTLSLAFLLLFPFISYGQQSLVHYTKEEKVIPSDFENISERTKNESKETLRELRSYVEKKEDELREVWQEINAAENDRSLNIIDTTVAEEYLCRVDSLSKDTQIDETLKQCLGEFGYMPEFYGTRKVGDLTVITERVRKKLRSVKQNDQLLAMLYVSQGNIDKDLNNAKERIDRFYGELYDEGKFRLWITCIFSCCVGGLLLFFFVFIGRNSETTLVKDFLSTGNGLQFITLFCLIIAIILFGVLGVLEGRELAAILSGISGYILGKGISIPKPAPKTTVDASHASIVRLQEKKE